MVGTGGERGEGVEDAREAGLNRPRVRFSTYCCQQRLNDTSMEETYHLYECSDCPVEVVSQRVDVTVIETTRVYHLAPCPDETTRLYSSLAFAETMVGTNI